MVSPKLIAANWKLNKDLNEVSSFFEAFNKQKSDVPTVFFVSPILLQSAVKAANGKVDVGAQNISEHESGAYTGESSAAQVKSANATWVLIGHSERRQHYSETNEITNQKIKLAMEQNLKPMLCVGESLEDREAGLTMAVIKNQLLEGLKDLKPADLVIAYEPVWAIGTGKVATVEQASRVHAEIRKIMQALGFDQVKILYGGSVKGANAAELMQDSEIDGVLVGGASLDASEFSKISNAARESLLDN